MEIRINFLLLFALGVAWAALTSTDPVAALDPASAETRELAQLEDEFARDRGNNLLARHLASRYLEVDRPGLAVAALRSAEPELLRDPLLSHRLAQAYEATGRMHDALSTAELALARCGRIVGTQDSSSATPLPEYRCDEADYAVLDIHHTALKRMVGWGVTDPTTDSRSRVAYQIAMRRATIASAVR